MAYFRRSAADRKAEAARYRQMTEEAATANNPYLNQDIGNLMELRMVLMEMNPTDPRIGQIDQAVKLQIEG